MEVGVKLDREGVLNVLPHRDPFLFVDAVESILAGPNESKNLPESLVGRKIVAWKTLSGKEEFFKGHFPGQAIMPGVLLIEALAQASGVLAYTPELHGDKLEVLLVSADNSRFRKPVYPPCRLRLEAVISSIRRQFYHFACEAFVGDMKVAEAQLTACLPPTRQT